MKYLDVVTTGDDVVVVFYEGGGDKCRVADARLIERNYEGSSEKSTENYGLEVCIDYHGNPSVSLRVSSGGSRDESFIVPFILRADLDVSEIRVFKLVGADETAKA